MQIFLAVGILLSILYALLMLIYRLGWARQKTFVVSDSLVPKTSVSVIIPARNEAANIEACLQSLLQQNFPKNLVEIIVVDDHSEDATASLAAAFEGVTALSLNEFSKTFPESIAFKKQALSCGIRASNSLLIVTTDADCILPKNWLLNIVALYEKENAAMIIGPVAFRPGASLVARFQCLDFMMMQGITAASHQLGLGSMANGANLAFSKVAFDEVSGYDGFDHFASGDDYVLVYKMKQRFSGQIHYLKTSEAIVVTDAQPDWSSFFRQRIRWASKSGKYPDYKLTAILSLVYLLNVWFLSATILLYFFPKIWSTLLVLLLLKVIVELMFLLPVSSFYSKTKALWIFPLLQPLHIAYIVIAGWLGVVGNYEWKGRKMH